ncbi:hypothetical protein [Streptomyces sp. PAN_FS17]|uniref:hypothetical protein n=1 Tax=Streptomyces sp. PAN_FS17 TaxID=1855351 RepID=UPI00089640E5|nr:hypothetical protein [Streptomyces sp. PAN_FS17]SEE09913.1 hypothetical protein SAMN05216482_9184 [Streptomyces sp. PAN_FS17]
MALLILNRLHCNETTDGPGADDIYIKVGNERVWGEQEFGDEQERNIGVSRLFGSKVRVAVWEGDDAPSLDDRIGAFWVHSSQVGDGEQAEALTGDGSHYDLYYTVVAE